jgi:hypothetical protein
VSAGSELSWLPYHSWGMCTEHGDWKFVLGENEFSDGPLFKYGGFDAVNEFRLLQVDNIFKYNHFLIHNMNNSIFQTLCQPLVTAASEIPTMSLRDDRSFDLIMFYFHLITT